MSTVPRLENPGPEEQVLFTEMWKIQEVWLGEAGTPFGLVS